MDNLSEIKDIWLSASVNSLPPAAEILKTVKQYRFRLLIKYVLMIGVSLLLAAVMVWVVFLYHSQWVITRIGEACMFAALGMLVTINTRSLLRVSGIKNYTNRAFLDYLKKAKRRQVTFQRKTQVLGLSLASAGLCLYLFEAVHKDLALALISYVLVAIWLAVNWLILRPRINRKKTRALNERIEKIEKLCNQLLDN